jgi:hypothetical protein
VKHEDIAKRVAERTGATVKAGAKGLEVSIDRDGQTHSTTIYYHPALSPDEYLVHARGWINGLTASKVLLKSVALIAETVAPSKEPK